MANIIQTFPKGSGGGHVIQDSTGTAVIQEKNMQFKGLSVTDNSTDEVTEIAGVGLNQDSLDDIAGAGLPGNTVVSSGLNYSTTEQIVGRWIDGKPLYQKTIDCGALPNNSLKKVAHGINNIDALVSVRGIAFNDNHNGFSFPLAETNSVYSVFVDKDGDYIRIETAADRSSLNHSYVTLQYTKTTS